MPNFSDIIGQNMIKEHLQNAIKTGNVSHAYIINGERYCGKEFIAKIFAMALQCEKGEVEPCNECHACKQALSGNQPDIIHITHEKPNTISVDDIREQINKDIVIKPYACDRKVYIINEAEKMNVQAQNAALKFLEEPPNGAVVILCVINSEQLLATVRSRCTEINISEEPGENTSEDSEILLLAEGYIKAVAAGNQFALWRFCEEHNSLSIRELEAVSLAVMQILTDMLCRRRDACGLSREELLHLTKLISRCLDYLKLNVNVKQIFGLLETDSILRGT